MGKKIIMFVSPCHKNASEVKYTCPNNENNERVAGVQTNEAPCKYFLRKYGDVSEVLGVVTETKEVKCAWDHLQKSLSHFCVDNELPVPVFTPVDFPTEKDFAEEALPIILEHINPNDKILLETTGGFRNDIMYLLLLSRILSYTGIPVIEAVYSSLQKKAIQTVSQLFTMFDLSEGMQNLTSFGNVQALRAYYGEKPADEYVGKLLTAMENLTEDISLCRTAKIDDYMELLNEALEGLKAKKESKQIDPLLGELLPVFRSKFGDNGKMTTPTLIRWCAENGMLQQALTVYTERMPAYLMNPKQGDFLRLDEENPPPKPSKADYESEELAYFLYGFLSLPRNTVYENFNRYIDDHRNDIIQAVISGQKPSGVPAGCEMAINHIIALFQAAKPHIASGNWSGFRNYKELPRFSDELFDRIEKKRAKCERAMVDELLNLNKKMKLELLKINSYLEMIKNLEHYLPNSGYIITCPVEQAKQIIADYVYIKFLRNITNHANDKGQESQREVLEYLKTIGYPDLDADRISAEGLRGVLLKALERLGIDSGTSCNA